jgi:hypothetical protein
VTDAAVFGAVAGAIVSWAASVVAHGRARRLLWTMAAGLMLVHSAAAFGAIYGWSHDVATAETRRQTRALVGIDSGAGIVVNYVFVLVWIADAIWWWQAPGRYARRPRWIGRVVHAFVWFMVVNGAVIFADGWMRLLGAIAVATVSFAWVRRR